MAANRRENFLFTERMWKKENFFFAREKTNMAVEREPCDERENEKKSFFLSFFWGNIRMKRKEVFVQK
jgi:hypothetical protein